MNEYVLPILSPTAPPSLWVSWRYLTLPRGLAPHALPFRLPANSLHPSKFSSWLHEVLHSRQNWTRPTLSPLCPPVTLHTKLYHNTQLENACFPFGECLLFPLLPQPSMPGPTSLIGYMVSMRLILMRGQNLKRQQNISPWDGAPVFSFVCLYISIPRKNCYVYIVTEQLEVWLNSFKFSVANFI